MSGRLRTATFGVGLAAALVALAWSGTRLLDGPFGPWPGGRLRGSSQPCEAADWSALTDFRELEIEVWPESPRSLTTWGVVHEGELFVPADFLTPWKRWPQQVTIDSRIRVRVDHSIFDCAAHRVTDTGRIEALRRAIASKYELSPHGRAAQVDVWWFAVGPR